MAMSASPWGWTPYGGCDYYGGPQLANRAPWYGYPSPSPSFASGYGVACGNSADLGTQNGQSGGAHRVFVEMPPAYEDIPSHAPGPGSAHDHVQTTCRNLSMGSSDSDNTYWNIHTYQMPDHVQKTCNIDFTSSDASDDCYWSVHTFPLSNTKAHVSQAQSSLLEGMVGDSMMVPPKAEYHEMQVRKVSNPIPGENTFECVTSENQSQLCETKWLSPEQQRPELLDKRSTQQVSATVEVFTPMGSGTLAQQQHDVTKIDHTADPKPIFSKLLEEDVANKEDNEQREQEVQRKREQDEWQMEIDHFRYNAFDRLEEEHVCEADTVEFDADYVLSSLKEVLYDGKLSLCHFNFERWVKQISKAEEKMLLDGIADLPLLEAINTVVAEVFMSRIEQIGNPHWNFRATSLYELKFSNTSGQISQLGSKEWNIISTKEISKDIVHLPFSEKIASWSLFPLQQDCTTDAKLIIQWDPGVHNNRESARISLLHPVTIGVRLILPWDPGNYSSKIRTKWLPLKSNTTNVNLLLPWDPGEQNLLHVHHMAIILFPLASNGSYVVRWQFLYHDGFSEARSLHGNDFSLVSSSYLKIVHPLPKSEIDLQLLQPAGLMVCTISLYSKAETNLFCTSWAGKFHYVAPAIIDCSHLSLHEISASIFALFKVCINIWKGVDTLSRVLIGNIVAMYMRICAPTLLQAEK